MSISMNNIESRVTALELIKSNSDLVLLASPKKHASGSVMSFKTSESFKNFYFLILEIDATAHTQNYHTHIIPTRSTPSNFSDKSTWTVGDAFATTYAESWAGLSFWEKESSDDQITFYMDNASLMNVFGYMRKSNKV